MTKYAIAGLFLLFALFLLTAGCMEPPIKEPVVSVSDIGLSDVSLKTMTINTTVVIYNPNPVGARLNKLAFDVFYRDDGRNYLGHGERSGIELKENGNTTVTIPVTIGNIQALQATGSLVRKGSIVLVVNGSAFIDLKVTSFEKRFEQEKEFHAGTIEGVLPGSSVNITDKMVQLGGFLNQV